MKRWSSRLFDPDPADGGNKPGDGGVEDKGVQEVLDSAMKPAPKSTVKELKVNGKSVTVDMADSKAVEALLQKGLAADERFEEAAEKLKTAERKAQVAEWAEQVKETGDPEVFRKFASALGLSKDRTESIIQNALAEEGDDEEYDDVDDDLSVGKRSTRRGKEGTKDRVSYADLDPDLQEVVVENHRKKLDRMVTSALEKDEKLSYNMKALTDEGKAVVKKLVWDKMSHQLATKGGKVTDAMLKESVLPFVQDVVIGLRSAQAGKMGLGPAPGGQDVVSGPREKPERVPITHPAYEEYLDKLIAYNHEQEGSASAQA